MAVPKDTSLGGGNRHFPSTRWSMICGAKDPTSPAYRDALQTLCRLYWKPVYAYVRAARNCKNDEAKDWAQEFLIEVIEGGLLDRYSPERGSFRSYLQGSIHIFLLRQHQKASAQKRGGGKKFMSLEAGDAAWSDLVPDGGTADPGEVFEQQWARSVVDHALEDLEQELETGGKAHYFQIFRRYEIPPTKQARVSHEELAEEFQLKKSDICNYLVYCRRRFRMLLVGRIRDYVTDSEELESELQRVVSLLGS